MTIVDFPRFNRSGQPDLAGELVEYHYLKMYEERANKMLREKSKEIESLLERVRELERRSG